MDFRKVDKHTGGKWLIYGTKHHKFQLVETWGCWNRNNKEIEFDFVLHKRQQSTCNWSPALLILWLFGMFKHFFWFLTSINIFYINFLSITFYFIRFVSFWHNTTLYQNSDTPLLGQVSISQCTVTRQIPKIPYSWIFWAQNIMDSCRWCPFARWCLLWIYGGSGFIYCSEFED